MWGSLLLYGSGSQECLPDLEFIWLSWLLTHSNESWHTRLPFTRWQHAHCTGWELTSLFLFFFFVLLAVLWLKAINNRTVPAQVVKCGECLICLSNNTAVSHHSGKMFLLRVTVKYLLGRRISSHQREAVLLVAWNAMDVKSCGPVSPKKCVYVCMYTCVCPKSGWVGKGWSPGIAVATASVM